MNNAIDELREVLAFLDGSAPLNGLWFGESLASDSGIFWWRPLLRKAIENSTLSAGEAVAPKCPYCDNTGDVHGIDGEWRGICKECTRPDAGVSDGGEDKVHAIYYMRDNHTFKRLSSNVLHALVEIESELNAGHTGGMLCSKQKGFKNVHCPGTEGRMKFLQDCRDSLTAALSRDEGNG